METFELILILLACVIASSPLGQVLKRISLPLNVEFDEIRRLRDAGKITKRQAQELRESVYLMQMTFADQACTTAAGVS